MKYRKKPVVVEAHQVFKGDKLESYPKWLLKEISVDCVVFSSINLDVDILGYIRTHEGKTCIMNSYYIVRSVQGKLSLCKPYQFEATYERVD